MAVAHVGPAAASAVHAAGGHHSHMPVYLFNMAALMYLTAMEIGLVSLHMPIEVTLFILLIVGAVKVWLIAMLFMHLRWDHKVLRKTALVPAFFVLVMFLGIGFTPDGAVDSIARMCGF